MKKVINVKEIMIILISLVLIIISTEVFAVQPDAVLGGGNNNAQSVTPDEYAGAQTPDVVEPENDTTGNNTSKDNSTGNNTNGNNTNGNNTKVYNTNNSTDLPQTGIEDYNIGILLIICIASAIFAYRKINDYRNI